MTGHRHREDVIRAELRHALDGFHPDRTVMLNRIAAGRAAAPARPRGEALRLAASALAVLTVLGIAGGARWATATDDGERVPTVAPPPAAPASSAPGSTTPGGTTPGGTAPASAAPDTEVRGHPGDTKVEKGSLWSDGSLSDDGESRVTLRPGVALTELDLTIRVSLTPGLTDRGALHDVASATIDTSVEHRPDALLYHFRLKTGETLPTGAYVFTARYDGGSRDAADDTYEAFSLTTDRKRPHVYGNFLPSD